LFLPPSIPATFPGEKGEAFDNKGVVTDTTAINIGEPQKCVDILEAARWSPILDGMNILRVYFNSFGAHH
jgi:hypothetical protein